jgi:hypothetical protein
MPSKKQPFGEMPKMAKMQRPPKLKGLGGKSAGRERTPDDPVSIQSGPAYGLIVQAINNSIVLTARYRNDPAERGFFPTRIGTFKGSYSVEAFQVGGFSESGFVAVGDWRCFVLADLNDVRDTGRSFKVPIRATEETTCFDTLVFPPA